MNGNMYCYRKYVRGGTESSTFVAFILSNNKNVRVSRAARAKENCTIFETLLNPFMHHLAADYGNAQLTVKNSCFQHVFGPQSYGENLQRPRAERRRTLLRFRGFRGGPFRPFSKCQFKRRTNTKVNSTQISGWLVDCFVTPHMS